MNTYSAQAPVRKAVFIPMRPCLELTTLATCALAFSLLGACSATPHATYGATFTDRSIRIESYAKSYRSAQPALVRALSTETRVFARIVPKSTSAQRSSMGDLTFDGGNWVARDFVDPFMFTDREAVLVRARATFGQVTLPMNTLMLAETDPLAKVASDPMLRALRVEQSAFLRLLDAEEARLERERTLPEGAADLMRTILLEWPLAPRSGAMHDLESTLAWRFQNVTEALAPNALSEAERDDLRSALTELEPRTLSLPKAAAAMTKLRHALDVMWVTPYATEDEPVMDRALTVYVGSPLSFDALDGAFETASRAFDTQVDAGFSVLDANAQSRVAARAKEILLSAPACLPRVPVRGPLDMAPPEERAWACSILHAFDDAKTDLDELAADLAWRDALAIARWAVSTHGPVRGPDFALRRAPLRLVLTPQESARLMLAARARPYRAIALGVAAHILTSDGASRARARAHSWRGIGDAPMDIIDEMLGESRPGRRR